ncbi:ABC transporter permease [Paenibacillus thiaminolyticus]|nr:ABC transporter permease [Paenibacillus thiaminolyticus]MCY9533523.1 ABC transporter permease [Paenibacillus thiaminolyticus]MCY9604188.1 ABC transporter permease [Paenibacillus thiaminolyticus]MCY9606264.1 ABC transporter permease [Paenibacillus thiaminolyticus]MCY9612014.1 ABC transporter permease [Paenibacillus thiaminolyticus]MCY9618035.1 ABC transporter permease [Paenibacillus thiaminolyticus]
MWGITLTELRQHRRWGTHILANLIFPLLTIFLLGSSLSGAGQFQRGDEHLVPAKVGIVQLDQGALSQPLERFLQEDKVRQWLEPVFLSDRDKVLQQVFDSKIDFGLVIPASFSEQVMAGHEASWEMIMGKSYSTNMAAKSVLGSFLERVNTEQAISLTLAGAAAIPDDGKTAPDRVDSGAARASAEAGAFASPVEIEPVSDASTPTAMQYYAVSMLTMFMLYTGMSLSLSVISDRRNHTFHRILTAPIRPFAYMGGKMMGQSLLGFGQGLCIIWFTHWLYGVSWGPQPWLIACICLLTVLASMSIGTITAAFARSEKSIKSLFPFLVITMTALSGGFVPINSIQATFGPYTVSHWTMQSLLRLMTAPDWNEAVPYLWMLAAIMAGLSVLAACFVRKVVNYV